MCKTNITINCQLTLIHMLQMRKRLATTTVCCLTNNKTITNKTINLLVVMATVAEIKKKKDSP